MELRWNQKQNKEEAARQQKVLEQARERFQELAEAEEKYISANIKSRAEALAAVEAMMRELDLTQSQYEAIRDALIAQNVISAAAGQAYAGTWEDLLYGDLAEYGVGYAPVLGNIYFAKKRKEAAASQAGTASGGVAAGGALPPDKGPEDDPQNRKVNIPKNVERQAKKLSPEARKGFEKAIEALRNGDTRGLNDHPLSGNRSGQRAIDIKGTGKGRGAGRIIYEYGENGEINIIEILTDHNY